MPVSPDAWVTSGATVLGAIVGALATQQGVFERLFRRTPSLAGTTWDSIYQDFDVATGKPIGQEITEELVIDRQRGKRIWGYIHRNNLLKEQKWEIEGLYDGNLLVTIYHPSTGASKHDYGCHFFKHKEHDDETFEGYSVGVENKAMGLAKHRLVLKK